MDETDSEISLSRKREDIANRIMQLSNEQFEMLLTLYSRQAQESAPADLVPHQTSA